MSNQSECICEYCDKVMSTISNLKVHQKTVKYCIKIQLEKKPELKQEGLNCKYCKKDFKIKLSLERHEFSCKINETNIKEESKEEITKLKEELRNKDEIIRNKDEKLKNKEEQNIELKEMIAKLQDTIAKIAEQPTNIDNSTSTRTMNVQLNRLPLDVNDISEIIDNEYTPAYFLEGQRGVANFFIKHLNKNDTCNEVIQITDASRGIIKYLDEYGNIVSDIDGYKIIKVMHQALVEKTLEYLKEYNDNYYKLKEDKKATNDEIELAKIRLDMALKSTLNIKHMNDNSKEFVKELTKKLIR